MALDHFYSEQIKIYIQQVQRIFSNFKIRTGYDSYGNAQFYTVPSTYGDASRLTRHIINQNTQNATPPVPFISVYDTSVEMAPTRRQNPNHVDQRNVIERDFDAQTNTYSNTDGNRYTIERFMPVPYDMTFNVDIWYTQTDHKFQICEQIMTLFNPDLDLQTSDNPLDWSALTTITMQPGTTWNARGIPVGTDDGVRTTSFVFAVPIWINPPAKVKRQKLIHQIVNDIYNVTTLGNNPISYSEENLTGYGLDTLQTMFETNNFMSRSIVTTDNHYILVENNVITLLGEDKDELDSNGDIYSWRDLIAQYDAPLVDNISLIRLRNEDDFENVELDYIGRIRYHEDANKLYWAIDLETMPSDTETAIDAIIDPMLSTPGNNLAVATAGQRYLLAGEIVEDAQSNIWSNISARVNDIIEFDGAVWTVSFDASATTSPAITTNNYTDKKIRYDLDLSSWIVLPDGIWKPGLFRLVLGD